MQRQRLTARIGGRVTTDSLRRQTPISAAPSKVWPANACTVTLLRSEIFVSALRTDGSRTWTWQRSIRFKFRIRYRTTSSFAEVRCRVKTNCSIRSGRRLKGLTRRVRESSQRDILTAMSLSTSCSAKNPRLAL